MHEGKDGRSCAHLGSLVALLTYGWASQHQQTNRGGAELEVSRLACSTPGGRDLDIDLAAFYPLATRVILGGITLTATCVLRL